MPHNKMAAQIAPLVQEPGATKQGDVVLGNFHLITWMPDGRVVKPIHSDRLHQLAYRQTRDREGRQTMVQDKIGGKFGVPGRKLCKRVAL